MSTSANKSLQTQSQTPAPAFAEEFVVRVRGLVKRYPDGTAANRGIDLEVRRGEVVSILGPNGAGKTTFLRQLTTELKPTSGGVELFGVDAVEEPQRVKLLMGITPQEAGIFETLTVRKREARLAAFDVADELGLGAEVNKRVGLLSGGQRRRILIGLALLGRPPLLILDEPTTGLDPMSRQMVWKTLRRAVAEGATLIFSTHYMEEAERLSDRIGIIEGGRLAAFDTLDKLFARLERSYRVEFTDPFDPLVEKSVSYFATFAEAQEYIAGERLSEYSIARASLEDIYFALTGERFAKAGGGGEAN
ncbi:MAG: ABC transporter ATP-binding protein [Acidobacteriota bacterium]|nr:ABC transporter ATP-binding protein [Acidobacteriota bacterium]